MLWYIPRHHARIGLPTATFDARLPEERAQRDAGGRIAGPNGQLDYHRRTRKTLHHIDHLLHWAGTVCFVATATILLAFLILYGLQLAAGIGWLETFLLGVKPFVTFFSAGLPALGAAVAGIRVHGDFEGSTERSINMVAQLTGLKDDYEKAMARGVTLNETGEILILTAGIMSEDLAVWQELYGRKRLALPA